MEWVEGDASMDFRVFEGEGTVSDGAGWVGRRKMELIVRDASHSLCFKSFKLFAWQPSSGKGAWMD